LVQGTTAASAAIHGPGGKSIAFDRDGNLWAVGPAVTDKMVARFPAAKLGADASVEPDISFDVPAIKCLPAISNIAFDPHGNLWLSACGGEVHRIAAADLKKPGDKTSDVLIAGLVDKNEVANNEGLAFDFEGNLWIGGGSELRRFDAARLSDSTSDAADLQLTVGDKFGDNMTANYLAFDSAGIWGIDALAYKLFYVTDVDLAQAGEHATVALTTISIAGSPMLSQPAFDDGGRLWLNLDAGHIGCFSTSQLFKSTGPGESRTPALIVESSSIAARQPIAFYPAPDGLPLYHALAVP
jgi:streptogramin lyase